MLKNFNLTVNKGQLVTIFAPEFSGKSTLAKIMCGLLSPSSGYVIISGYKAGTELISMLAICRKYHLLNTIIPFTTLWVFTLDFFRISKVEKLIHC